MAIQCNGAGRSGDDGFFGSGSGRDLGRVRDAAMASRVECSGSRGKENGDAVREDAADRTREAKLSAVLFRVSQPALNVKCC